MLTKIYTQPAVEPVSLAELKLHLGINSDTFSGNTESIQSIAPGLHTVDTAYVVGVSVEVLGYNAMVNLVSGENGTGGTVDAKIMESDTDIEANFSSVTSGAFTQVTTANDNATQEKAYTGSKRYIRVDHKVLVASCNFNANVVRSKGINSDDDLLTAQLITAREDAESGTHRKFITQTWDFFIDKFPCEDYIDIPFGNLQSVTSVIYKDVDGVETTMTVTTDYIVELNGDQYGRIFLPYGMSWPSETLYPSKPICIRFVCGYGLAADVPSKIKSLIKMICTDLYKGRGEPVEGRTVVENKTVERLKYLCRLWGKY